MMLLERRRYDLRPGAAKVFWEVQAKWADVSQALSSARNNLGYFHSAKAEPERIVHLYAWDDLAQWQTTYADLYLRHPAAYFDEIRPLLVRQHNSFYKSTSIDALAPSPLGTATRPSADIMLIGLDPGSVRVLEERIFLSPGTLTSYMARLADWSQANPELAAHQSMGAYTSTIGSLNQVLQYRWFRDCDAAQEFLDARRSDPAWDLLRTNAAPDVIRVKRTLMNTAPLPWLRHVLESAAGRTAI